MDNTKLNIQNVLVNQLMIQLLHFFSYTIVPSIL